MKAFEGNEVEVDDPEFSELIDVIENSKELIKFKQIHTKNIREHYNSPNFVMTSDYAETILIDAFWILEQNGYSINKKPN